MLSPDVRICVFEYDKHWLADGFSLSPLELPLREGLFYGDPDFMNGCFAVFEDSLPDGYGLYLLDKMLREENTSLKELSPLQRLAIVGSAGMGALEYSPSLSKNKGASLIDDMDVDLLQQRALDILSEKSSADAALLYYNSRNSGGARPKAVVQMKDGTGWIIKFRHTYDAEDIGLQEYKYNKAAEACGINVVKAALVNKKYFACRRFDIDNGERLHTVTAAALMKTDFRSQTADYSNLLALTGYLTQNPVQVEQMFRIMVFNIVADNKDDHAKNISFIYKEGTGWSLAPAYDLTYSPQGTRGEHSTSVMYSGNPSLEDILKAGTGIRIPRMRCLEIIDEIQDTCLQKLDKTVRLK